MRKKSELSDSLQDQDNQTGLFGMEIDTETTESMRNMACCARFFSQNPEANLFPEGSAWEMQTSGVPTTLLQQWVLGITRLQGESAQDFNDQHNCSDVEEEDESKAVNRKRGRKALKKAGVHDLKRTKAQPYEADDQEDDVSQLSEQFKNSFLQ